MCDHNNHKIKSPQNKMRHGSSLKHGEAHFKDHKTWSRRNFIRNMGLAGGMSMVLGKMPITASSYSPLANALSTCHLQELV